MPHWDNMSIMVPKVMSWLCEGLKLRHIVSCNCGASMARLDSSFTSDTVTNIWLNVIAVSVLHVKIQSMAHLHVARAIRLV